MLRQVNRQEKESKAPKRPLDAQACRRKKIAGTLGGVVTRNTQPMPLTSWRAASRAPLGCLPPPSTKVSKNVNVKVHGICKNLYQCSIFRAKS